MPASTARQVVIDDGDPLIQYSSGWKLHSSNRIDGKGNSGSTLDSTLHGTQSNGTSFKFNFLGTEIYVFGTTNGMISNHSWDCSVDGSDIVVESLPSSRSTENNSLLCSAQDLTDASHNLTVAVNDFQNTFLFDYLRYTPSNNENFDDALVFIPFSDPNITFQGNWDAFDNATISNTEGSSATIAFTGISAQWYGIRSPELPTSRSQASYSVDGGPNNPLFLDGLQSGQQVEQVNQRIFETPVLPFGHHNITVNFNSATGTSTPLTLTYLLVQNATSASPAPSLVPLASTPLSVSSLSDSPKKTNVAGIVGGLLGSLLLLCLLAFLFFQNRKRKSTKWDPTVWSPFRRRHSIPRPIETGNISTLNLFGSSSNPSLPIHRPQSQKLIREPQPSGSGPNIRECSLPSEQPANLDENASYYGGYQTWGQAKALEAASGSRQRDSYM